MSIFTNVNPNLLNGTADGTVDASDDLVISFQVNGTAPMADLGMDIVKIIDDDPDNIYSRIIYHQPAGTAVSPPFYGKDNLGNIVVYTKTIAPSDMTFTPGVTYENNYNYEIWLNGRLEATFQTRKAPYFTVTPPLPDSHITTRKHTFDFLTFSDPNLQWFRWKLGVYDGSGTVPGTFGMGEVLYDTGKVYGSGDMTMTYEGFIPNVVYTVQCTACDSYGRIAESGGYVFWVTYTQEQLDFPVTVSPLTTGSAIHVEWQGANYLYGEPTGEYEISDDNILYLPTTDDYITWDTNVNFSTPWTVVYKGLLLSADAILWEIQATDSSQTFRLRYDYLDRSLIFEQGVLGSATTIETHTKVFSTSTVYTILTFPDDPNETPKLYIRLEYMGGGLYPSETLHPAETLYPSDSTTPMVTKYTDTLTGVTADPISGIAVYGAQKCYFIQEFDSDATYEGESAVTMVIAEHYDNNTYEPVIFDGVNFYATFANGLNAGSLYYGAYQFGGWAIYRKAEGDSISQQIAVLPIEAYEFNDYTARTDGTKYVYDIAPIFVDDQQNYTNGVAISSGEPFGILHPCYTILDTKYNEDMLCYELLHEYDFGMNVKTGEVSNNNSPNILQNFTRYPTVQMATQNYMSGSLNSLIGVLDVDDGQITYSDTRTMRDAIFALSTTSDTLFLKTRKGDILKIRVANPISMSVMDDTFAQALEAQISWVEVADATRSFVLSYKS